MTFNELVDFFQYKAEYSGENPVWTYELMGIEPKYIWGTGKFTNIKLSYTPHTVKIGIYANSGRGGLGGQTYKGEGKTIPEAIASVMEDYERVKRCYLQWIEDALKRDREFKERQEKRWAENDS